MLATISTLEMIIGIVAIVLMFENFIFGMIVTMKGKKIANYLRQRHPSQWEEMGKPKPSLFYSVQRTEWQQFLINKKYLEFEDPRVKEMGEAHHALEKVFITNVIISFGVFAGIVIWDHFLR